MPIFIEANPIILLKNRLNIVLNALLGMQLLLFRNISNRALLMWAFLLMVISAVVDFIVDLQV